MPDLSPQYAAELADDIYVVKSDLTRGDFKAVYEDDMELEGFDTPAGKGALKGTTGAFVFIKTEHVMGVAAIGKGAYQNQAFVVLKGTASLLDALTDANAGLKRFATGGYVHQGFFYTFQSFLPHLKAFQVNLGQHNIHTIHCVGHSLGGALATLAADWLQSLLSCQVKLYTFGSPRVGLSLFASQATGSLGAGNIFRVYHRTDPVPMVPTWPFVHVPTEGDDYLIDSPVRMVPWHYHSMGEYKKSTKGRQWIEIKNSRPLGHLDQAIENWLKSNTVLTFTANTLDLLNAALWYVVKKIIHAAGIVLVGGFATTFTLLDRLAYLMSSAFDIGKQLSEWVVHLIRKMAQLLGIVIKEGVSLTHSFIRYVFVRLHTEVGAMIRQAGKLLE